MPRQRLKHIRVDAALGAPVSKVSADQFSLFENAGKETSLFEEFETQNAPVQESVGEYESFAAPEAEQAPAAPFAPAEDAAPFEEDAAPADPLDTLLDQYAYRNEEPVQDAWPEAEASEVDAFMRPVPPQPQEERSGSMPGARPAPVPPPMYESENARSDFGFTSADTAPAAVTPPAPPAPAQTEVHRSEIRAGARPVFTVSKPRVALLILFLLFAVPITLACIVLLLLPAALALGAAVLAGWLGFAGLTATFGSFTVFADILLVFGCTLIVLALALLFLWIFIWLLGGVIPGLIRGVSALARKWCYKEVPVQ